MVGAASAVLAPGPSVADNKPPCSAKPVPSRRSPATAPLPRGVRDRSSSLLSAAITLGGLADRLGATGAGSPHLDAAAVISARMAAEWPLLEDASLARGGGDGSGERGVDGEEGPGGKALAIRKPP